jgi:hypothetical protein
MAVLEFHMWKPPVQLQLDCTVFIFYYYLLVKVPPAQFNIAYYQNKQFTVAYYQ